MNFTKHRWNRQTLLHALGHTLRWCLKIFWLNIYVLLIYRHRNQKLTVFGDTGEDGVVGYIYYFQINRLIVSLYIFLILYCFLYIFFDFILLYRDTTLNKSKVLLCIYIYFFIAFIIMTHDISNMKIKSIGTTNYITLTVVGVVG